jgi:hypothetical protein
MRPWTRIFVSVALFIFLLGLSSPVTAQGNNVAVHENLSKENKTLLLNAAVGAAVLTWGLLEWDYGDRSPHFKEEKWFGKDTPEGGADKAGHMYFSYALSHLFSYQYKRWGYDQEPAIKLGCLSSLGIQTLIEIGDSFSSYGFSYEDELFNILGVAIGYVMVRYPEVSKKFDFRIEYDPFKKGKYKSDISTDYRRQKHLIAVKMDGFDTLKDTYLKYFELQVGYYARGYEEYDSMGGHDSRHRTIYVGVGLNIGKILEPFWETKIFNYIQVPYTYVPLDIHLDQ